MKIHFSKYCNNNEHQNYGALILVCQILLKHHRCIIKCNFSIFYHPNFPLGGVNVMETHFGNKQPPLKLQK
jgi:hypothetical protein